LTTVRSGAGFSRCVSNEKDSTKSSKPDYAAPKVGWSAQDAGRRKARTEAMVFTEFRD